MAGRERETSLPISCERPSRPDLPRAGGRKAGLADPPRHVQGLTEGGHGHGPSAVIASRKHRGMAAGDAVQRAQHCHGLRRAIACSGVSPPGAAAWSSMANMLFLAAPCRASLKR